MFVILTYDVNSKRVAKVMKLCRKYLPHVQRSVFEGDITEKKLNKLKKEIRKVIDYRNDNVCIYEFNSVRYTSKEIIGPAPQKGNIICSE